ncbi:protein THEM6 [Phlebotomus argentipes]|uniref:protein THEM6 n=1 Tax=Phlebotomus argentipes TaxID=94469 RepID=UPI0028931D05|nr:protein THEM6 [Phlebotomus argentipes]
MIWCYLLGAALVGYFLAHAIIEVHYFLRMLLAMCLARFFKKRCHIMDMTSVTGLCLTTDIDTLLFHMNNARYFRELDFAKADFYERTGLYRAIMKKGGSIFQGAATIRYRRFIKTFTRFKITTRIIYWDEKSIFMEHKFISPSDGFVRCVVLSRQRVVNLPVDDLMNELLGKTAKKQTAFDRLENGIAEHAKIKPSIPLEVAKWMEWNEISSANLRTDS